MPRVPRKPPLRTLIMEIDQPAQSLMDNPVDVVGFLCRCVNYNVFSDIRLNDETHKFIRVDYVNNTLSVSLRYDKGAWAIKQAEKLTDMMPLLNLSRIRVVGAEDDQVFFDRNWPNGS